MNSHLNKIKPIWFLLLLLLTFGCSGGVGGDDFDPYVSSSFSFGKKPKTGLIVFSQYHFDEINNDTLQIRQIADEGGEYDAIIESENTFFQANDFEEDRMNGALKIYELPAGSYEIHNWSMDTENRNMNRFGSVPFRVRKGEITYLGGLHFKRISKGTFNSRYALVLENNKKRDLKLFKQKMPNLAKKRVRTRILKKITRDQD